LDYTQSLLGSIILDIKQQGNRHIIVSDAPITNYEEQTRWSDFKLILVYKYNHYIIVSQLSLRSLVRANKFNPVRALSSHWVELKILQRKL